MVRQDVPQQQHTDLFRALLLLLLLTALHLVQEGQAVGGLVLQSREDKGDQSGVHASMREGEEREGGREKRVEESRRQYKGRKVLLGVKKMRVG